MEKRVAVITINWKKYDLTKKLLLSLKKSTYPIDVFVGDNDSDAKSLRSHLVHYCKEVIPFKANTGFAYPNNYIAKRIYANYELLLFINNDCRIKEDAIEKLVNAYDNTDHKGVFQPILLNYNNPELIQSAGFISVTGSKYGGFKYESKRLSEVTSKLRPIMEEKLLYGACFLINATDYQEIGGLDESYYYQLEDVDLGKRLCKILGYKLFVVSDSFVYHKSHGSESLRGPRHIYYWIRNFLKINSDTFLKKLFVIIVALISLLPLFLLGIFSQRIMAIKDAVSNYISGKFHKNREYS